MTDESKPLGLPSIESMNEEIEAIKANHAKELATIKTAHEAVVWDLTHKINGLEVLADSRVKGLEQANAEAVHLRELHKAAVNELQEWKRHFAAKGHYDQTTPPPAPTEIPTR